MVKFFGATTVMMTMLYTNLCDIKGLHAQSVLSFFLLHILDVISLQVTLLFNGSEIISDSDLASGCTYQGNIGVVIDNWWRAAFPDWKTFKQFYSVDPLACSEWVCVFNRCGLLVYWKIAIKFTLTSGGWGQNDYKFLLWKFYATVVWSLVVSGSFMWKDFILNYSFKDYKVNISLLTELQIRPNKKISVFRVKQFYIELFN